jgi:hypothetical protein
MLSLGEPLPAELDVLFEPWLRLLRPQDGFTPTGRAAFVGWNVGPICAEVPPSPSV